jgi:hypothetical protein
MSTTTNDVQSQVTKACAQLKKTVRDFGIELETDASMIPALEEVLVSLKEFGDAAAVSGACFMVGAYLGELLRARIGGEWVVSKSDNLLSLVAGNQVIYPVEKVRKFVSNPASNDLSLYVNVLSSS